ncbi:nitrogen fixation negative regulator NifL [Propionivibrio dicarboxylicus]|uniref:histidine kinase n=1 Tax=Propionivibrio dicarboxylicus TaxID=83767 RepID=A0A1G7VE49_9RHOO|nr:nitrogen fixation negative regulator NifL [Propionivibrio dicarboxylicus]SDG58112.1 Histidine kinase-, DNA gyrase B-, and HSP90-like ATPase [Propionivibrio dicarboxylicus]
MNTPQSTHGSPTTIVPQIFEQAVEQADIAISISDVNATIIYVNPAFVRMTGYAPHELVGANQSILSNKSTPVAVYDELWAVISRGLAWNGRLVNRRKDGSKYLADLLITPVVDGDGEISHYLALQRDVTPLHRLECEVAGQKALIETVVDSAPLVIALVDRHDKVVLDNHEYKKLMGDLRMVEPARLILDAVRADGTVLRPSVRISDPAFSEHELRLESPAGPRWFSCSGLWVQRQPGDADGFFHRRDDCYLLLIARETTRQRAEQEKTRMALLQAMMAEESRIDTLQESLSAAVYKIEGPVNVMASVMATIERRSGLDPAAAALREALAACRETVETLRAVIPEHRPESQTTVNINEVMRDVLDISTERMLAAGITVHWQPQAVMPPVLGYAKRLRTMFKAIVDNAIDAMNAKGWTQRELRVTTRAASGNISVIIEDSGPGIPIALRLKVFEPFYSTRKAGGQHLGTGLSSAQQVAAVHEGVIRIEAGDAGGCAMHVTLPALRKGSLPWS